jgi:putative ABC transport system permease protein
VTPGMLLVLRALVTGPLSRRPIRAALPALGVAIGVAAVAAIQHANSSVAESFRDSAKALAGRSDLVVVGARGVPLADLERLRFLWGVGSFAPLVSGNAAIGDAAPEVVTIVGTDFGGDAPVRDMRLAEPATARGRFALSAPGSVLVPVGLARRHGLSIGSRVPVRSAAGREELTVAGLLELSGIARAAGGDVLVTDLFTAGRLLGRSGFADRVDVVFDPGIDVGAVRAELSRRLPPGLWVEPPGRAAQAAERMTRAFRFNLNALGLLTVAVGMFLVGNAVSISVLRRRPEIATLRALGASRRAVFAAFALEGLVVGAAGTLLGLIGGLALSRAALAVVSGTVSSVYSSAAKITEASFAPAAFAAAMVGVVASLVAAAVPAIEAIRVAPSPALRAGSAESVRRLRLPWRAGAAAAALAAAGLLAVGPPIGAFPWLGFGAVALVVVALALVSPALVRAGGALLRLPLERAFGAPGRLAVELFVGSLARNGIAVTALAMALGMTLAMIATIASMRETVRAWVGTTLAADLWVRPASRGRLVPGGLPEEIVGELERIPGVAAVDPFRVREGFDGAGHAVTFASSDFRVLSRAGGAPLIGGGDPRPAAERARANREVFVSEPYSRRYDARHGGAVSLRTPQGVRSFRVAGVYRDFSNDRGTVLFDRSLYLELFDDPRVTSAAIVLSAGQDPATVRREILSRVAGKFGADVITTRELRDQVLRVFDRTFAVTNALEAIAVAVAVAGIANALIASAVERRRSFGLLRAIGASTGQIRSTVLLEALLAGLVATTAAVLTGSAFTLLLLTVINPQSFGWTVAFRFPAARLAAAAAIVVLASIAAGILPGRIAAAADPATALAEE